MDISSEMNILSEMDNSGSNTSSDYVIEFSPGMTKYYIPHCNPCMKPHVNQKFPSLDVGVQFYKNYALACGFDIRRGTTRKFNDGTCLKWRYIICNREGVKNASTDDMCSTSKKRRTVSNRVECKARVVFKFVGCNGYVVTKFTERHTYTLVPEAYKHFMKMNKNLDYGHKKFVLDCAKANIGAMKSYKMLKEVVGAYSSVGCTHGQIKNFSRDLKAYVLDVDAQMILDKLMRKRELCPAFVFKYEVDTHDQLKSLFWADPISRQNYCAFEDVISFDATYNTNRYSMIFAPFTGKNNHGRCVTLGVGLLSGESHELYAWLFEQFKKCMGYEPSILMIDQDPATKIAVQHVFKSTKHRLCIWHIMMKVPEKVPTHLKKESIFMKKFSSLVWSVHVEPNDFEARWKQTMDEFGLMHNPRFNSMYDIRETWIPTYFRDFPMGSLFKTTSPSESENNFFRTHMNKCSNLLEFFMYFDNALESQRHSQAKLNNEGLSCHCDFKTLLPFEKHTANVYTKHIFNEVQDEVVSACYNCRLKNITDEEYNCLYEVDDRSLRVFDVTYDKVEKTVVCSCKKFVRIGLLCCHVFFVFKDLNFESIPDKYIVSRWTKLALSSTTHIVGGDVKGSCVGIEENRLVLHDIIFELYSCVGLVEGDPEKSFSLLQAIRDIKNRLKPTEEHASTESVKKRLFEQFYKASVPDEVSVKPPVPVKTKGSSRL